MSTFYGNPQGGNFLPSSTPLAGGTAIRPIGWNRQSPEVAPNSPLLLPGDGRYNVGITLSSSIGRPTSDYSATNSAVLSIAQTGGKSGGAALQVSRSSAGTSTLSILHSQEATMCRNGRVGIWIYVPDYTKLTSFIPKVSLGDSTFTNGYFQTYNFADADKQFNGWHFVAFSGAEWTGVYGAPNWATQAVSTVWVDIVTNAATSVIVDSWMVGWASKARIMIMDDDCYVSWATLGLPVLDAYGLRGVTSVIAENIGRNASWMTMQQLEASYLRGHEVSPHGAASLATLANEAAREADVQSNKDFLVRRGLINGTDFYVYPNGVYQLSAGDQQILNILKRNGFRAARSTSTPRYTKHAAGLGDNRWLLPVIGMDASTSAATIKSRIDTGVANGDLMILMLHTIVQANPSGIDVAVDSLDEVCKYISELCAQGKLTNITPSQL